jgi:hypothetical protein
MTILRVTSNGGNKTMSDCWYPIFLDQNLALLRSGEEQAARDWINKYVFDETLRRRNRSVNVTEALRDSIPNHPNWSGTPMEPLWERTGQDEQHAAFVYGNLVCRVGVQRPETWWVYKITIGFERSSSLYVYDHE